MEDINKLSNYLVDNKYTLEYSEEELNILNEHISNNDYDAVIDFFKFKELTAIEVEKDMLLGNVESLWDFIMDEAYKKWNSGMSREQFLLSLTPYEMNAVQFGNFNAKVNNGGLTLWEYHDYSEDAEDLYSFVRTTDYKEKETLLKVLENFIYVRDSINDLDPSDDFYEGDVETRLKYLDDYDDAYYRINDSWKNYFEDYLFKNITDDYKQKLYDYNQKINI